MDMWHTLNIDTFYSSVKFLSVGTRSLGTIVRVSENITGISTTD